ncbi:flagellar hook assembly protein FlgD [Proteus hauseri]|uniref:flagellar hook assembly protein FlgD n=1 Tax=Proteus hauseri TaxID=183417 RepID=UPI001FC970CC|nr:flagellar hook assembly protein FlgD [Proteus hauseri]
MGISASMNEPYDNTLIGDAPSSYHTKKSGSEDIKGNFLNLLIAQMKNQDPTNPMQNNELTTQLAQISTVEGIEKLNKTVNNIVGQIDQSQALRASSLVGRGVMVSGNKIVVFQPTDGKDETDVPGDGDDTTVPTPDTKDKQIRQQMGTYQADPADAKKPDGDHLFSTPFGFELLTPTDSLTITITNSSGATVRTINMDKKMLPDVYNFSWDCTDEDDNPVPAGSYKFTVNATLNDAQVPVKTLNYALVNSVSMVDGTPRLDVGLGNTVSLDEIRQVL